jgi:perosamine synthetase
MVKPRQVGMALLLDAPNLGELERKYVDDAILSGFVSSVGAFVGAFEDAFAGYLGVPSASSAQSGTAALHMALYDMGVGPGDEVIVPVMTFAATVNPVLYLGATPVFVDIDPETLTLDPSAVAAAITSKTKAIIPVHLYGNPCDMDAILSIANPRGIFVVEDATESLGAYYRGRHTGTLGDAGCFSFNGNKLITTGGGGMLVSNDHDRVRRVKHRVNQAKDPNREGGHTEIGFNYRMTNIEAALGMAQFSRISDFLARKAAYARIYADEFSGVPGMRMQRTLPQAQNAYWFSVAMLPDGIDLPVVRAALAKEAIPTRALFLPLTENMCYHAYASGAYPCADKAFAHGVCLPSSTLNSEDAVRCAAERIKTIVLKG